VAANIIISEDDLMAHQETSISRLMLLMICAGAFIGASGQSPAAGEGGTNPMARSQINGEDVVVLRRKMTGNGKQPEFLSATVLPGRGMNLFQITAYLPGKGERNLLASPSLAEAAEVLTGTGPDRYGDKSHSFGAAFLVPFANRIRGKVSADKSTVTIMWQGQQLQIAANWRGKTQQVEPHAMHGFIMKAKSVNVRTEQTADGATVSGEIRNEDMTGQWFSQNEVSITESLSGGAIDLNVTVKNVGQMPEPVGVGWHPYFAIQSGDRKQLRLHLPGSQVTEVNNHTDEFPTGKLSPVENTTYDFTSKKGAPLEDHFYDDSWVSLKKGSDGQSVSEIMDPAAHLGIRITALSPEINAVQVYAPPDKPYVALEPQFNWNDPFGSEWQGKDTHMVTLLPGHSVAWRVRVELFVVGN
jgi:aldose 1-epimerase